MSIYAKGLLLIPDFHGAPLFMRSCLNLQHEHNYKIWYKMKFGHFQEVRFMKLDLEYSRLGTGSIDVPNVLIEGVRGQHKYHNKQSNDQE